MGLFNWRKKKKKEETASNNFLGLPLLEQPTFDFQALSEQLKQDWGIEVAKEGVSAESLVAEIDNMAIMVGLIAAPVPDVDAQAKTNHLWEEAVSVAEKHQAHLLVSVLKREQSVLDASKLFVKVLSSISKQSNVIGLNILGTVLNPEEYTELAESAIKMNVYPVLNLVFIRVYSMDGGNTFCAYTYGLNMFDKEEMEILNSKKDSEDVFSFLVSLIGYVIEYDVILKDGETVGFTEEEKLKVTYSKGEALPFKTLKIAYYTED